MAKRGNDDPGEKVAMVLSGGVALGAYQAGAYAALHERGEPRLDWLAGASVGAVNATIIAGNPPERRVERLRQFWAKAGLPMPLSEAVSPVQGPWRHALGWMSVLQSRLFGLPGLFRPRASPWSQEPWSPAGDSVQRLGLYDPSPLRSTLGEVVDFGRLNGNEIRVSVLTIDVTSGEEVIFDTARGDRIGPDHLLASCGFLPEFPPVWIGRRLLGDGGLGANAPIDVVLGEIGTERDMLCFVVDLFARDSAPPRSLEGAAARRLDLIFSNQARRSLDFHQQVYRLRHMIARLGARLPPGVRMEAEMAPVLREGYDHRMTVLYLSHRAPADAPGDKTFDFSAAALAERWNAGALDMTAALRTLADLPNPSSRPPGLTVHQIRR
ncbi:MAG TPA: patatin-like phospholipase family protein [Alphaproteobacteria bacterium]